MRLTFLGHAAVHLEIGDPAALVDPSQRGTPVVSVVADDLAPGEASDL